VCVYHHTISYRLGRGEYVEVGLDVSQAKNYAIESSSELLTTLSDLELITDFATWIFKESPEHFKKVVIYLPTLCLVVVVSVCFVHERTHSSLCCFPDFHFESTPSRTSSQNCSPLHAHGLSHYGTILPGVSCLRTVH
jgi:hypothetical protein